MGIQGSATVTIQFMDVTGASSLRPPITGTISRFFAKQRSESPGSTDVLFGSPDWLTDVIVVDDPAKLAALPPSQTSQDFTSGSSKHVLIQCEVGNDKVHMEDCFTIATGTQASVTAPVIADHVVVLPPGTQMVPGHPFFGLWAAQAGKSQAAKAARAQAAQTATSPGVQTTLPPQAGSSPGAESPAP